MNKILSTLIATSLLLAVSCNDDDQAEPTVQVKFIIDASTSCNYSGEANPDESIAIVRVYKNIDDWNNETNAIFSGNPNSNGVINLGVLADGTYYYDLEYKGETNWEANPLKGNGQNMTFVWNRNLSSPIEVSSQLHFGNDSILGKYILKEIKVIAPSGVVTSEYPDTCKEDINYVEFFKDMTVNLSQRATICFENSALKEEELVLSGIDCGAIGQNDIAHQSGANIKDATSTSKETWEVRNGKKVIRYFNETFFRDIEMIYEKQ